MNRYEVIRDKRFIEKCNALGLEYKDIEIYNGTIIAKTYKPMTYVIFDNKYNIIHIHQAQFYNAFEPIYYIVNSAKNEYETLTLKEAYDMIFPHPLKFPFKTEPFYNFFEDYTLKQIVDLADRIDYFDDFKNRSWDNMVVNYERIEDNNSIYVYLLSYIKFLAREIDEYYINSYHAKMLNIKYTSIFEYLIYVMMRIDDIVNDYIKENEMPYPRNIINNLGQKNSNIINDNILELNSIINFLLNVKTGIINLSLNIKGYEPKEGDDSYREIESTTEDKVDIVSKADDLLSLLDVSDEEIKVRREEYTRTRDFKTINLGEYLSKKRGVSLLRKKNSQ